jgi:hypothetical protein
VERKTHDKWGIHERMRETSWPENVHVHLGNFKHVCEQVSALHTHTHTHTNTHTDTHTLSLSLFPSPFLHNKLVGFSPSLPFSLPNSSQGMS